MRDKTEYVLKAVEETPLPFYMQRNRRQNEPHHLRRLDNRRELHYDDKVK